MPVCSHLPCPARLVPDLRHRRLVHRAGLALAEPLDRVVQRPPPRRGTRHRALQLARRSEADPRRVARGLQLQPPALVARECCRRLASRRPGGRRRGSGRRREGGPRNRVRSAGRQRLALVVLALSHSRSRHCRACLCFGDISLVARTGRRGVDAEPQCRRADGLCEAAPQFCRAVDSALVSARSAFRRRIWHNRFRSTAVLRPCDRIGD
jgi:hypothetical protein